MNNLALYLQDRLVYSKSFLFLNAVIFFFIGLNYLPWVHFNSVLTTFYFLNAYIGHFLVLVFIISVIFFLASIFIPRKALLLFGSLFFTFAASILMIDMLVYGIYRFHLSGFVLDLLFKAGSDVFNFSAGALISALVGIILLMSLQYFAVKKILQVRLNPLLNFIFPLVMLISSFLSHGLHAYSDFIHYRGILSVSSVLPVFYGLTAKRFIRDNNWFDLKASDRTATYVVSNDNQVPNYPFEGLKCDEPAQKNNVLIIVVDALRADMLSSVTMPHLEEFSRNSLKFLDHYSNGNSTKAGIFSLFYGLPSSYWDAFTGHSIAPLMLQRVKDLGYEEKVLASATLLSPAFNKNVFSSIEHLQMETPGDYSWQRDELITNEWLDFMEKRAGNTKPFFGVLFYDTTHSYTVPKDYKKFEPFWESVNYLKLSNDFDPEPYKNVYRTAVHFTDNLIGKVLRDLEQKNLLKETVVVVTSDHGEEFNDNRKNFWGHGSNFSAAQLKVPLVIHWPGKKSEEITKRTEHFDIAPTILEEFLGCEKDAPEKYSLGHHLLKEDRLSWSIAHSYTNYAVLMNGMILENTSWGYSIYNDDLNPNETFEVPATFGKEYLTELSRFYK